MEEEKNLANMAVSVWVATRRRKMVKRGQLKFVLIVGRVRNNVPEQCMGSNTEKKKGGKTRSETECKSGEGDWVVVGLVGKGFGFLAIRQKSRRFHILLDTRY